jgi:tight adherence protein B
MIAWINNLGLSTETIIAGIIALCAVMIAEAIYLMFASANEQRTVINRRLKVGDHEISHEKILLQLRKERGLDESGGWRLPVQWLNKLILQSGQTYGLQKLAIMAMISAVIIACLLFYNTGDWRIAAAGLPFGGIIVPLLVLKYMRRRRLKIFARQLPDAIELIVRSLKAGHPVPVSLSLVSRDMADPIGSEFGLMGDEIAYGSTIVQALYNMRERVGYEDLHLFIAAISIQNSTGGNLREILEVLATVLRERMKMRRKIRSISAEGRISAILLTAMPVGLFFAVQLLTPDYYGEIINEPLTLMGLVGAAFWLLIGNVMMMKMVSFKV